MQPDASTVGTATDAFACSRLWKSALLAGTGHREAEVADELQRDPWRVLAVAIKSLPFQIIGAVSYEL